MSLPLAIFAAILPLRDGTSAAGQIRAEDLSYIASALVQRVSGVIATNPPPSLSYGNANGLSSTIWAAAGRFYEDSDAERVRDLSLSEAKWWPEDYYRLPGEVQVAATNFFGISVLEPASRFSLPQTLMLDDIRRMFYDLRRMGAEFVSEAATNAQFVTVSTTNGVTETTTGNRPGAVWSEESRYIRTGNGWRATFTTSGTAYYDLGEDVEFAVAFFSYAAGYERFELKDDGDGGYEIVSSLSKFRFALMPVALEKNGGLWHIPGAAFDAGLGKSLLSQTGYPDTVEVDPLVDEIVSCDIYDVDAPVILVFRKYPKTDLRAVDWNWSP